MSRDREFRIKQEQRHQEDRKHRKSHEKRKIWARFGHEQLEEEKSFNVMIRHHKQW